MTQLVFVSKPARAAVVGTVTETPDSWTEFDFVDLEVNEVQSIWNNASSGKFTLQWAGVGTTAPIRYDAPLADLNEVQELYNTADGGTFTISFDGQGPTSALAYNASAASVEAALEALSNITDVTVAGSGTSGSPWVITFVDPGSQDVDEVSTGDSSLTGTSTIATTQQGGGGPNETQTLYNRASGGTFTISFDGQGPTSALAYNASAASVEAALEALANINDVTVSGTGTMGDPWVITFVDPGNTDVAQITTDDSGLTYASTVTTTTDGNLSVETALEGLFEIQDVQVAGAGTQGNPWLVTFVDPGGGHPNLIADDSLLVGGSTTITETTPGASAPTDPAGIAYLGGNFLISDSEINEEPTIYDGANIWEITDTPTVVSSSAWENPSVGNAEPTGLDIDLVNNHLYISDDDNGDKVYDVDLGPNGVYDPTDSYTTFEAGANGVGDPEDVAWDSAGGMVFVASGVGTGSEPREVTPIDPGPDGDLGTGDDVVGASMDFTSLPMGDLEGLGYRAFSDTLLMIDPSNNNATGSEAIIEITKDGRLVRYIKIQFTDSPSDVVAVGPQGKTLYVVDRGNDNNSASPPPRDGRWYEIVAPFDNLEPFVDAGSDQIIGFGDPAALVGDTYDDGQGSIYSTPPFVPDVTWSKVSGPGNVAFSDANSLSTSATFSAAGVYVLKLSSTDGDNTSEDMIQVTMSADPNQAPLANAGPDQTITLPSAVNLSGTANDDGMPNPPGALTTTWSKVSGPGTVTFGNASALSTTATFSAAGTYVLRLTADDSAKQHSDDVTITVNPAPAIDYFDDDDGNIFENDINWLAGEGITKGCGPRLYCPDDLVTRGQMAAFLKRALNLTDGAGSDLFIDDDGHLFENDIDLLGTAGITRGCNPPTNDKFCPDQVVTRGAMAAFLVRALGLTDGAGSDLFVDDDGHLFENDIDKLATAGITKGCNPPVNDKFCPDLPVTRGAMAAFLHRALG